MRRDVAWTIKLRVKIWVVSCDCAEPRLNSQMLGCLGPGLTGLNIRIISYWNTQTKPGSYKHLVACLTHNSLRETRTGL